MTLLSIFIILALLARAWTGISTQRQLRRIADALEKVSLTVLVVTLAACSSEGAPQSEVVLGEAWRACVSDHETSCSSCTLTHEEAVSLTGAHAANHSANDDEIYYFEPCLLKRGRYGIYSETRPRSDGK